MSETKNYLTDFCYAKSTSIVIEVESLTISDWMGAGLCTYDVTQTQILSNTILY